MSRTDQNFFFGFHWNDYCNATGDLDHLHHGSYLMCMLAMYRSGKPIPKDGVYRAVNAFTKEEQDSVDYILSRFFKPREGDCWGHDRIEEELRLIDERRRVGKIGGQSTSEIKKASARENAKKATVAAANAARIEREFKQAELLAAEDESCNHNPQANPQASKGAAAGVAVDVERGLGQSPTKTSQTPANPARQPTASPSKSPSKSTTNRKSDENPKNGRQAGGGVTEDRSSIMGVDTPKPPFTSNSNINGKTKVDPERQRWLKFLKNAEGLPDVMRCAEPTAEQREKVLQQLNAIVLDDYDRKSGATKAVRMAMAIDDWVDMQSPPLHTLQFGRWQRWLETGTI